MMTQDDLESDDLGISGATEETCNEVSAEVTRVGLVVIEVHGSPECRAWTHEANVLNTQQVPLRSGAQLLLDALEDVPEQDADDSDTVEYWVMRVLGLFYYELRCIASEGVQEMRENLERSVDSLINLARDIDGILETSGNDNPDVESKFWETSVVELLKRRLSSRGDIGDMGADSRATSWNDVLTKLGKALAECVERRCKEV